MAQGHVEIGDGDVTAVMKMCTAIIGAPLFIVHNHLVAPRTISPLLGPARRLEGQKTLARGVMRDMISSKIPKRSLNGCPCLLIYSCLEPNSPKRRHLYIHSTNHTDTATCILHVYRKAIKRYGWLLLYLESIHLQPSLPFHGTRSS